MGAQSSRNLHLPQVPADEGRGVPTTPQEFANSTEAQRALERIQNGVADARSWERLLPDLVASIGRTASPDRAVVNLERLLESIAFKSTLSEEFCTNPQLLDEVVTLLAGSQFLADILIRSPELLDLLRTPRDLAQAKSEADFDCEVSSALSPGMTSEQQLDALRRYQRREVLRVGTCDLLGLLDMPTVTTQLSFLANSLVRACAEISAARTDTPLSGFAVIALGKLGGGELNYSSDVDLLFLSAQDPLRYVPVAESLTEALGRATSEGFLYRVDLRLRPWGTAGALVSSAEGYQAYVRKHARLWEKQALSKARAIAGDVPFGKACLRQVRPLLYTVTSEQVRANVRDAKERIEAQLSPRERDGAEVKLGRGSIRDVEFVTQYLQLVHCSQHPEIRSRNTLRGLGHLASHGLLSSEDYRVLVDGYTFLRPVEHYLQLTQNQQTHTLPAEEGELEYLARRLGFAGAQAGAEFLVRYQQHTGAIRAVYQRHLEDRAMSQAENNQLARAPDVPGHLSRMAPSYAATFAKDEIRRHAELVERLSPEHLIEVDAQACGTDLWRVTVVGYDFTGELSLICGLFFANGLTILDGDVFTYEESALPGLAPDSRKRGSTSERGRKIVDVFTVRAVLGTATAETWVRYATDLESLLRRLQSGEQRETFGALAKRVAVTLRELPGATSTLPPVDIEIDNEIAERYTVLNIRGLDTIGFLYEVTSALALQGISIARVTVGSAGNRVRDTLYLTDHRGHKILSPDKQRELRAATVLVKHFTHLLPLSPNPEAALLHFHEFLGQLFMRPDWPDELSSLERPEVLGALARLLGVSEFLWDDFLRMQHANLFPVVQNVETLAAPRSPDELRSQLDTAIAVQPDSESRRTALNAFKDREMFRIDMRHILGHTAGFGQFASELSDLAEMVVASACQLVDSELRAQHGIPRLESGDPCPYCVCALGKLGGRELGFASDVELLFFFGGNGSTNGEHPISTAEYYEALVSQVTQAIRARQEGIFEIDLRLRPFGQAGSLAVSMDSFRRYYGPDGPAWPYERQALVKLRPFHGDQGLGQRLLALRDAFVYTGEPFDVRAMRAMRERQLRHLVAAGTTNVKYSPGGLVDLEYLTQALQLRHGPRNPALRLANTRQALDALGAAGVLTPEQHRHLCEALAFLRHLIDSLRMVRGNAKDLTVPPDESEEFAFLARRLGYGSDRARLRQELRQHMRRVQELGSLVVEPDTGS